MLHNTFARLRGVRVRITIVATVLTGVALTVAAVLLVSTVENRLESEVRGDTQQAAARVADALQGGQPFSQAVEAPAPAPGTQVFIVGPGGDVLASTPGSAGAGLNNVGLLPDDRLLSGGGSVAISSQLSTAGGTGLTVRIVAASNLAEVKRSVSELSQLLWAGIPVLVVLVGVLAWLLAGRALKPVDAMRREVDEITDSTLHRRVPEPGSGDEVARLAHTMNAMLDRLEAAADRQRHFVSDASHELRSPLTTIRAKVEVASLHPTAADWDEVAGTVLGEVERLDDLVADLLQLARVDETGGAVAEPADVDLDEVVAAEARRLRGLDVAVDDSGVSAARIRGDRAGLARAVRNLADNAARHARHRVALSVGVHGGLAVLRVDDDGPGVPPADRERIFERFARLDEGRVRGAGGAGLGLALVRAVATAHGGTVMVTDAPLGGARFEVAVPAAFTSPSSSSPDRGRSPIRASR